MKSCAIMKLLRLLVILPILFGIQCEDDIFPIEDILEETGILGRWEFADETVNGISDLLPKCCKFFEFMPDNNVEDLNGLFLFTDGTVAYSGIFTLDEANQQIVFQRDGKTSVVYDYNLNSSQDYLTFSFVEGENLNYLQGWAKRN